MECRHGGLELELKEVPGRVAVGFGADVDLEPGVLDEKLVEASRRRSPRSVRAEEAGSVAEAQPAVAVALGAVAALVDEPMVVVAEEGEVVEARLAAVRPGRRWCAWR